MADNNEIKRDLNSLSYTNGIHALAINNDTILVGNGLNALTKYLFVSDSDDGWTPAPEDLGLPSDNVIPIDFHLQAYLIDNYSSALHFDTTITDPYQTCLNYVNKSTLSIYLDYDLYSSSGKTSLVNTDIISVNSVYKDEKGELCVYYYIQAPDDSASTLVVHQFYLLVKRNLGVQAAGTQLGAQILIK
mgnify:FL=1